MFCYIKWLLWKQLYKKYGEQGGNPAYTSMLYFKETLNRDKKFKQRQKVELFKEMESEYDIKRILQWKLFR